MINNFYSTEMRNGNENKTNLYRFVSEIPTKGIQYSINAEVICDDKPS